MSLPSSATRQTIRSAALTRFGVNREGDTPQRLIDYMNEAIQSGHTRLYAKFWWVRNRVSITETFPEGTTSMNVPEQTTPGLIEFVWIQSTRENGEKNFHKMRYGVPTPMERESARTANGTTTQIRPPELYWLEDGILHIAPETSEVWDTITIQYQEREMPIREDTDRIHIDEELMKMWALMQVKKYFTEDVSADLIEIDNYIDDLQGINAPADEGFNMGGGMRSIVGRKQPRNDRITGFYGGISKGTGIVAPDGYIWPSGGPYA